MTSNKSRNKKLVVVIGAIILAVLYSLFYLGAFWDPYSRLDAVPFAVVNEDTGATISGDDRNIGQELCDTLKEDGTLKFEFVSREEAEKGVRSNQYYAIMIIPSSFSEDIASTKSTKKITPKLEYQVNEKRNYLASQILNNAVNQIEKSLRSSLDKEITLSLADKLNEVPTSLTTLSDGMQTMYDGALQVQSGTEQLKAGTASAYSGSVQLNSGAQSLTGGLGSLSGGLNTLQAKIPTLESGVTALNEGVNKSGGLKDSVKKYTDSVATAATGSSLVASGLDTLETTVEDELAPGVITLVKGAGEAATGAEKVATGASQVSSGASQVATGATTAKNGADALYVALGNYRDNMGLNPTQIAYLNVILTGSPDGTVDTSKTSFATLKAGLATLDTGASQVATGATSLNSGASSLNTGVSALNSGISTLASKLPKLEEGITDLSIGANTLNTGLATITSNNTALNGGVAQLATGTQTLYNSIPTLKSGISQLSSGANAAVAGSNTLANGTSSLTSGLATLDAGAGTLASGTGTLAEGIKSGKDQVVEKTEDAQEQLKALNGLEKTAADPVELETEKVDAVPNYGTAFAPYFMSLSLWVGAIMVFMSIYYDPKNRFKYLGKDTENKVARTLIYLAIAIGEAVLLALLVKWVLGLETNHTFDFIMAACLVSVTSLSIVEFCMIHLGDIGKFLSLILLILQLTSCAGTFPVETVPKFFQWLYPFMPMTYAIKLFKETISGTSETTSYAASSVGVLVAIFLVFSALIIGISLLKKKYRAKTQAEVA